MFFSEYTLASFNKSTIVLKNIFKFAKDILQANSAEPDAASDLALHCLPMFHKMVSLLISVNQG